MFIPEICFRNTSRTGARSKDVFIDEDAAQDETKFERFLLEHVGELSPEPLFQSDGKLNC